MEHKGSRIPYLATDSMPRPGDFVLGSGESRAAARTMAESRAQVSKEGQILLIILDAGQKCPPLDDPRIQAALENNKSASFVSVDLSRSAGSANLPETLPAAHGLPNSSQG